MIYLNDMITGYALNEHVSSVRLSTELLIVCYSIKQE